MTTWTKNITRFASLMVALGLMLGLAVTGCSDKDRDGGRVAEMANIAYNFSQLAGVGPKATEDAVNVVLTAFDADGKAVAADQETQVIAEHKDVTPAELVGGKIYEGAAQVDTTATKLVLTYINADGDEVGSDVVDNVNVKEGAVIDFTAVEPEPEPEPTAEIVWVPAEAAQKIAVGETLTITANNGDEEAPVEYAVTLAIAEDETHVTVANNVVTAVDTTEAETPVAVTATAKDENGEEVGTMVYNITVVTPPVELIWTPAEENQTIVKNDTFSAISAIDAEANVYTVVVSLGEGADKYLNIDSTGTITGKEVTPAEVTATVIAEAKNAGNEVVGTKTYAVTVTAS